MIGLLGLLIPLAAGLVIARHLFALRCPVEVVPVGLASGSLLYAIACNLGLRAGLSIDQAAVVGVGAVAVLAVLVFIQRKAPPWQASNLGWPTVLYLGAFSFLIYHTVLTILFLNPDDDFWIHAPMQAQLLKGNFPLKNPAFPDLSYGGHYARDLFTVLVAWWSDTELYSLQPVAVAFLQLTAFWLIFAAGLRFGGGQGAGVLASLFLYTGVNAASRGGWLDTVANNNALAQMHTALLLYLFCKVLFTQVEWREVVLTAVLFAGLAWSYETNFVVLTAALLALALIVALKRELNRTQLARTGVVVLVAFLFMALQGGVLGEFLHKLLRPESHQTAPVDLTTQAQNLEVSVHFPKEKLFEIKLNRAGDEVSLAYAIFPVIKTFGYTPQEPGYVSIFNPAVWRIHWISFYLFPFTFVVLWRSNQKLGLLFWSYGLVSYLIPSVIDFGLWEDEVFRWQYAASSGFAGALGIAVADRLRGLRGPFSWNRRHLIVHSTLGGWVLVALLLYLNCYPSWVQIGQRGALLPTLRDGLMPPSTQRWLEYHPELGLNEADLQAARALRPLVKKGDRLLMERRSSRQTDIFPESAFLGLTGSLATGHAFPLVSERLGTMPFRQSSDVIAFWRTADPKLLKARKIDWLYQKKSVKNGLEYPEGQLTETIRIPSQSGDRVIYRVDQEPWPPFVHREQAHPLVQVTALDGLDELDNEEYRNPHLTLAGLDKTKPQKLFLSYRFFDESGQRLLPTEEGLTQELAPFTGESVTIHFVAPHNPGRYLMKLYLGPGPELFEVGQMVVETRQLEAFQQITAEWADPHAPLQRGVAQTVGIKLKNPSKTKLHLRGWIALQVEGPESPLDLQPLDLRLEPNSEKVVTLTVAPVGPGGAEPFRLILNPQDGFLDIPLPRKPVL